MFKGVCYLQPLIQATGTQLQWKKENQNPALVGGVAMREVDNKKLKDL